MEAECAIKSTERDLAGGTLIHADSAMMAWCVGNCRIVQQGNAVSITKQASGSAKIDPVMGVFNTQSVMNLNPEGSGKSFWESAA